MKVYRITTAKWSDSLTASGYAARWNSKGIFSLYTAESRSLACLENLVHRNCNGLAANFKVMTISVPDTLDIDIVDVAQLPLDWQLYKNIHLSQRLGDEWYSSQRSCILKVPSVIIPEESNYLINTRQPLFNKVKIEQVDDFLFDQRLSL